MTSAPVINLSMAGALLEVPCTLRIGAVYTMRLALSPDRVVDVKGKVVRSYVHGFEQNDRGETVIKYRAAVQFDGIGEDHQMTLQQFIQTLANSGLRADLRANPSG